jgi:hypothetical protein
MSVVISFLNMRRRDPLIIPPRHITQTNCICQYLIVPAKRTSREQLDEDGLGRWLREYYINEMRSADPQYDLGLTSQSYSTTSSQKLTVDRTMALILSSQVVASVTILTSYPYLRPIFLSASINAL